MTPTYNAQFAKPLVNQLIALLQRDQQSALDIINAGRPAGRELVPFTAFFKEAAPIQNWPALVLVAQQTAFDANTDIGLRTETVQFYCAMAIAGTDPEWLAEDAMDYLRAVDMVLTSAALSDFYLALPIALSTVPGGVTAGLPETAKIQDLRVTRHNLGSLVTRRSGVFARGPQIEFEVEMEEQ